jgi:FlaA1/EpsC-like NDP-sugar epimerase
MERVMFTLRKYRTLVALGADAFVVAVAWQMAFLFRLGAELASMSAGASVISTLVVLTCYLSVFGWLRLPRSMWRFAGMGEVRLIAIGTALGIALSALALLLIGTPSVPRAVVALHPVFVFLGCCAMRFTYRAVFEWRVTTVSGENHTAKRTIVLGAGFAAQRLLASMQIRPEWNVVALLDDDRSKHRSRMGKVAVWGGLEKLTIEPERFAGITHAIVAMPSAGVEQRKRAIQLAKSLGMSVFSVPTLEELMRGASSIDQIHAIEPEDLLGRDAVSLDDKGLSTLIRDAIVMVTGAGGSIGSELCRQIARLQPKQLVLFEQSEYALYQIEQQLSDAFPNLKLVRLIGDVKDRARVDHVLGQYHPNLIFHAAAYKHVPLVEEGNEWQALQNNIYGTYCVANAARAHGVERFVLISTDKAVNPTNVMGASKRAAEMVLSNLATHRGRTRFMAVRFGNVLGSSGSVIPKFKEQIAAGGPVTVTHPEMTRFFMTIPEAAVLVLQAAAIGETGQVYVLDMGQPVRIVDMAKSLIALCGKTEEEIPIVFTGLRPGEKLYEELLADTDTTLPTLHPKLRIAVLQRFDSDNWISSLLRWLDEEAPALGGQNSEQIRYRLKRFVPEYTTKSVPDADRTQPMDRYDFRSAPARGGSVLELVAAKQQVTRV